MITRQDATALLAGAATALVIANGALLLGPVTAKINPAELPDVRPVVVDGGTYTPFTTRPTRPPHPIEVYRPPTDGPSSNSRTR